MSTETKVALQQEKIFGLLQTYANPRGYVKGLDIERLGHLTGVSLHDVTKTLWGLQKRELVGFSEKKGTNGHSIPYRFRIKKRGLNPTRADIEAAVPVDEPQVKPEPVVVVTTPKKPDYIRTLLNRENDLRFAATILGDYGMEDLGVQVLEKVRLTDDEYQQLKEYYE